MKEIIPISNLFLHTIGFQKVKKDTEYSIACYCTVSEIEDGYLIYNSLTKQLLLLDNDEYVDFLSCNISTNKKLINFWFLVSEENNNVNFYLELRNLAGFLVKNNFIKTFVIMTTTQCNARCYYCYENGSAKYAMTETTAEKIVSYIKDHSYGENVKITWFGGEPLLNIDVIDLISNQLTESNVQFSSEIITNAYLFDSSIVLKAKRQWKIKSAQITIDGTEKNYNRIKSYIYKEANPFKRIIENIHSLLNSQIYVLIRINVNEQNVRDAFDLVDYLSKEFYGKENFNIYATLLYGIPITYELADRFENLINHLYELGYLQNIILNNGIVHNSCMADTDTSVLITPSGNLGKCEHYFESKLIGNIESEKLDHDMINNWKKLKVNSECLKCPNIPFCNSLQLCPDRYNPCNGAAKAVKTAILKLSMKDAYNKFKNGEINEMYNK